ncbi:uncharacterized protein LOC125178184 [Hyalella azteca]|uniref:Uncharacterized protein LOC125178184 n=1 Tax=Hyalella azteca TaxID=294128 RepID=A0A979FKN7_HYAAZ|nr:uncharacterized protein LOC125178184 [Hyalella azteca]
MNLKMDSDDIFGLLNEEINALGSDEIPSSQPVTHKVTHNNKDLANQVSAIAHEIQPQYRLMSTYTKWSQSTKAALSERRPIPQLAIRKEPPLLPTRFSPYSQTFVNEWQKAIRNTEMKLTQLWNEEMDLQLNSARVEWRKLKDEAVRKLNGSEEALKLLDKKLKQSSLSYPKAYHQNKRRRSD